MAEVPRVSDEIAVVGDTNGGNRHRQGRSTGPSDSAEGSARPLDVGQDPARPPEDVQVDLGGSGEVERHGNVVLERADPGRSAPRRGN